MIGTPPVSYFNGTTLSSNNMPLTIAKGAAAFVLPGVAAVPNGFLDLSGFNTLSIFVTLTSIVGAGANTLTVALVAIDPDTGAAVGSGLGAVTLFAPTAAGNVATTVYLPTVYAAIGAAILPFYLAQLTFTHTGGTVGNAVVGAVKLWLSNA